MLDPSQCIQYRGNGDLNNNVLCLCLLTLICSGGPEQNDSLVASYTPLATPMVAGLEDRGTLQVQNGHDRQINFDINKPNDQSPQHQQQYLMSSAKPVNIQASSEASVSSMETTGSPQQQVRSEPANAAVSQTSKVSSGTTQHSDAKLKSSGTTRGTGMHVYQEV